MSDLDRDTRVEGVPPRLSAELHPAWNTPWEAPNGGYLATLALRAAAAATELRRPASLSVHYLERARPGDVELHTEILRAGNTTANVRVRMGQDGRAVLDAVAWMAADREGIEHDRAGPQFDVPELEGLPTVAELLAREGLPIHAFWDRVEVRPLRWEPVLEPRKREPVERAWFRFRPRDTFDDPVVAAGAQLILMDVNVAIPVLYPHGINIVQSRYLPASLDLMAQFHRADAATPWLLCEAEAPIAHLGLIGGRARVWNARGEILSSGLSHLLCMPKPESL